MAHSRRQLLRPAGGFPAPGSASLAPPPGPPVPFSQCLSPKSENLYTGGLTIENGLTPVFSFGSFCVQCFSFCHCASAAALLRPAGGHSAWRFETTPYRVFSQTLSPSGWAPQPWLLRSELTETALGTCNVASKAGAFSEGSLTSANSHLHRSSAMLSSTSVEDAGLSDLCSAKTSGPLRLASLAGVFVVLIVGSSASKRPCDRL